MRKLILASLTISSALAGQTPRPAQPPPPPRGAPPPRTTPLRGSLERRLTTLLDQPPFNRATWNVHVVDDRGAVLFPPDYRVRTSLYANGTLAEGVLQGDLILYGRGDPTWSQRCFGTDTLAAGVCDST